MSSIDQPEHGACVFASAGKWTYDAGLLAKNTEKDVSVHGMDVDLIFLFVSLLTLNQQ